MKTINDDGTAPLQEPLADLERQLISDYVVAAGFDLHSLLVRKDEEARRVLTQAFFFAAGKLTEIEARSRYLHKLHGEP